MLLTTLVYSQFRIAKREHFAIIISITYFVRKSQLFKIPKYIKPKQNFYDQKNLAGLSGVFHK